MVLFCDTISGYRQNAPQPEIVFSGLYILWPNYAAI